MNKSFSFFAKVAFTCCLALFSFGVQNASAQSMGSAHSKGERFLNMLVDEHDQEVVRIEYDLIFSSPKETIRNFSEGYTYTIFAFADEGVDDLDLVLYKKSGSSWVEVAKDVKSDDTPVVTYKPTSSGEYKIAVKVYKFASGYDRTIYGLFVSHEN